MKRLTSFLSAGLLIPAGLVLLCSACVPRSTDRPNVILITLDTTRADRLGCYGYPRETTPNLDALAREGTRFDLALAQASVTPVSHASIFTGQYPFQHGVRVLHGANSFRLEEGTPTLATILREEGWRTGAFVSAFPVSEYFGFQHGFDVFSTGIQGDIDSKLNAVDGKATWGVGENQRRADVTMNEAFSWLDDLDAKKPFFLWLHFFDPHDRTVLPPPSFWKQAVAGITDNDDLKRRIYDEEIRWVDTQLGRLFERLRATEEYENTLFVVTNDHGEGLGDHDWWFHRILYQEQIRMPLIFRGRGVPKGMAVPDLVRGIDILPTILKLCDLPVPENIGKEMTGLMRGEKEPERVAYADALLRLDSNSPSKAKPHLDDLFYCVMTRSWKLIHRRFHPESSELYRLDIDPTEQNNVIEDYPEKHGELMRFLNVPGVMIDELISTDGINPEAVQRLKALGYN